MINDHQKMKIDTFLNFFFDQYTGQLHEVYIL